MLTESKKKYIILLKRQMFIYILKPLNILFNKSVTKIEGKYVHDISMLKF